MPAVNDPELLRRIKLLEDHVSILSAQSQNTVAGTLVTTDSGVAVAPGSALPATPAAPALVVEEVSPQVLVAGQRIIIATSVEYDLTASGGNNVSQEIYDTVSSTVYDTTLEQTYTTQSGTTVGTVLARTLRLTVGTVIGVGIIPPGTYRFGVQARVSNESPGVTPSNASIVVTIVGG